MIFPLVKKDVNCLVIIKDYIEGEDFINCFDAYGIQEPNIELPSNLNNFELHEESSLEAIPTDFEKVISDLTVMERMRLYSLIPLLYLYAELKCCKKKEVVKETIKSGHSMFPKHRINEISACRKGCCAFSGSLIDEEFCPVCDKRFLKPSHLEDHQARHNPVGQHPCMYCPKVNSL